LIEGKKIEIFHRIFLENWKTVPIFVLLTVVNWSSGV
jgi:hypothetical protein